MGVKLYAFAVSAGLAAVAGILIGFRGQLITYGEFNVFSSINSLGHAVIGGLGYVLGAAFAAPNAIGGLGPRVIEDWINRSEEHTSELQSLMRISYAVVWLKKKKNTSHNTINKSHTRT